MPVTALDPVTALVVIDLQKGIAKMPTLRPFGEIVAKTVDLAKAFRAAQLPVVLVNVGFSSDGKDAPLVRADVKRAWAFPPDFSELAPELDAQPSDLRITKRQPNAFYGTELDLQLRRRRVTGIVLTGISTSSGVDGTARAAIERGYNVTFASDAITDADAEAHDFVMKKLFPRFGEVDTTAAIVAMLAER